VPPSVKGGSVFYHAYFNGTSFLNCRWGKIRAKDEGRATKNKNSERQLLFKVFAD
jgi:hypothetical protein